MIMVIFTNPINITLHLPSNPKKMAYRKTKGPSTNPPMEFKEAQLKSIFTRLDSNQDGRLGLYELKEAFNQVGAVLPIHLAYQALCHADRDRDGRISQDEMWKLLNYIVKQGYLIN